MLALLAPAAAASAIRIPNSGLYQIQYTGPSTGGRSTTVWVSSSGSTAATPVELFFNATASPTSMPSPSTVTATDYGGYTSPQMLALNATSYVVNENWFVNGSWGYYFSCPSVSATGSFLVRINASAALSTTPIVPSNSTRIPYPGALVAAQSTVFQVGGPISCSPPSSSSGSLISQPWGGGFYFNITTPGTYYLEVYLVIEIESFARTSSLGSPSNTVCLNLQGGSQLNPSYCPAFTAGPRPGASVSQVFVG